MSDHTFGDRYGTDLPAFRQASHKKIEMRAAGLGDDANADWFRRGTRERRSRKDAK